MIKDILKNAKNYYPITENLKKGLNWLETTDLSKLDDGKYYIDKENIYASVQTYITKDNAKYESHRKYIDIQYMIEGEEKVGITDLDNCKSCMTYDKEKDLEFYDIKEKEEEFIELKKGQFLILFPNDAHKPSIYKNNKIRVKKIVIKVALNT